MQGVDARIKTLVADMLETMYDANGIGLAATQVDVHERLVVIDVSEERNEPLVLINPEIVWASDDKQAQRRGLPLGAGHLRRRRALDGGHASPRSTPRANRSTIEAEGLLAVCIQHEMDHLLGKVFVEYLSPLKRNRIKTKMLKQQREDQNSEQREGRR